MKRRDAFAPAYSTITGREEKPAPASFRPLKGTKEGVIGESLIGSAFAVDHQAVGLPV